MKRTIAIDKYGYVYYRGKRLALLVDHVRAHFKIKTNKKYAVTITKGTKYQLFRDHGDWVGIYIENKRIGGMCGGHFEKLFFVPSKRKRYDITAKQIKAKE